MKKMKPNRPKNATVIEKLAALKRMLRNRVTSSIGSLTRRSQSAKAASRASAGAVAGQGRPAPASHAPGASIVV